MSSNPFDAALTALGNTLGDDNYALVGGGACVALGSSRATQDIDFVVPGAKLLL